MAKEQQNDKVNDKTAASPNEAEDRRMRLKTLIVLGKERGYLTYAEINDHLPDDVQNSEQIDGIIGALAVTVDPAEVVRLLGESAPLLWADMPTLPLYRQQRTLLTSKKAYAVSANPTRWGAGWNMDRWELQQ